MSNLCLIDLKDHNLNFTQINHLAKTIVLYALENDKAVFFNSYDYGSELIIDNGMNSFLLISDSFIYKQADFLNISDLFTDGDIDKFRNDFCERFKFFYGILELLERSKVHKIDIYLDLSCCCSAKEFFLVKTDKNNLLNDLFDSIIQHSDEYAYGFPPIKAEVVLCT